MLHPGLVADPLGLDLLLRQRSRRHTLTVMPAAEGRRPLSVPWLAVSLFALAFGFMGALWATRDLAPGVSVNALPSMSDCMKQDFDRIGPGPSSAADIKTVSSLCWQQIQFQGTLNDFEIRRLAFFQQYYSNPVLLWMVVIVTLSGVGLAGLQLLASFELAGQQGTALAQDGDIEIDKGRIALKSSVTGLFILVMSFAFFIVFVKFIYRIDSASVDPGAAQPAAGQQAPGKQELFLPEGHLGPPAGKPVGEVPKSGG